MFDVNSVLLLTTNKNVTSRYHYTTVTRGSMLYEKFVLCCGIKI